MSVSRTWASRLSRSAGTWMQSASHALPDAAATTVRFHRLGGAAPLRASWCASASTASQPKTSPWRSAAIARSVLGSTTAHEPRETMKRSTIGSPSETMCSSDSKKTGLMSDVMVESWSGAARWLLLVVKRRHPYATRHY